MNLYKEMTDEALALAYIEGNNQAFDILLERNQKKVFSYILFVVRDRDAAEDVFQDTFLKAIACLQQGRYTDSGKFSAWLMRIAHNVMMDWYRTQKHSKVIEPTPENDLSNLRDDLRESNVEDRMVNDQVLADVRSLMDQLPAVQREVVFMRFYQQLSFKEIAEMTGVSINTSLGRMRYALLNLRKMTKGKNLELQFA